MRTNIYEIIKKTLGSRTPIWIQDVNPDSVHAAVLIPLFSENGEHKILFTKRSAQVKTHKGQISFPGGVVEERDQGPLETALREAHEEIGLLKEDVEILGQADDATTVVSNFIVHPFVGVIPYPYDFTISSEEVDRIIKIPLRVFLENDPKYRRTSAEFEGVTYPGSAFKYKGDVIWGATARILMNLVGILEGKLDLHGEVE
ncbi:MAG: CoA pyrophosphatase [Deltaproteobacteria bacterium]|nr:CoA pyrophosphatase [Deltaproteobacteria bacterium]